LLSEQADEAGEFDAGPGAPTSMSAASDLISRRLRNQHLTRPGRCEPAQVVASLGDAGAGLSGGDVGH
jgi:hypothetical protein